ncbi:Holliday junction resolvase RuvX [Bifidobacterium sp. SMB2]|uniref:Putative pre-16S rRNA nuclease n=1 Tax=Bifidobacterium saimiriisciurei TaxID=2661627 RepID=A0ABX0C8Z1_9BIFI|nr:MULTISPECIES: Holliday junction resolvase RuvX [Bifidobacterium]NEG96176.1 Holliday junction resolvase RuvX [Bifidobacterium sp. SMB2]NEH10746.1 Holliday junction resolvase RuvX [Bifidobacterium saimiriisciurei]
MSYWLGIDLGNARVGLALSDPELTFAHPIGNIQVRGDYFQALYDVLDVIEDNHVDHVVVGYPLLLNGTEGASAKKARRWAKNLERRLENEGIHATVQLLDERMTTVSAHRQLSEAGLRSREHRPSVDQQSAVVLLQAALDAAARATDPSIGSTGLEG